MERMGGVSRKGRCRTWKVVEGGPTGRPDLRWKDCFEKDLKRDGGMVIGGSGLWIGGVGELWSMMRQLASVFFLTPCKRCMR